MKTNKIANILFIIGIVIIILGFISGLVFGQDNFDYYTEIMWPVVLMYWFTGFVSGMLFIGIAEIIEILDTKLSWIQRKMSNESDAEMTTKVNDITTDDDAFKYIPDHPDTSLGGAPPLSKHKESFIRGYFNKQEISINKLINTPFNGICMIQFSDGEEKFYDIDGFSPEEVPNEKWDEKMKQWFETYRKNTDEDES